MKKTLISITVAYICTTYSGSMFFAYAQSNLGAGVETIDTSPDIVISELQNQFSSVEFDDNNCDAVSMKIQELNGVKTVVGLDYGNCVVKESIQVNKKIVDNVINVVQGRPIEPISELEPKPVPTPTPRPTPRPTTNTPTTPKVQATSTTTTVTQPTTTTVVKTTPTTNTSQENNTTTSDNNTETEIPKTDTVSEENKQGSIQTNSNKSDIIRNLLAIKNKDKPIQEDVVVEEIEKNNGLLRDSTTFLDITLDIKDIEARVEFDKRTFFVEVKNPALTIAIQQKIEGTTGVISARQMMKKLFPELLLIEVDESAEINNILNIIKNIDSIEIMPNLIYPVSNEGFTNQSVKNNDIDNLDEQRYLNFIKGDTESCEMGPTKVNVAIVDNAFEPGHEDLDLNVTKKYDVSDKDNDINPIDPNNEIYNHGTVQAGIIGAEDNGQGVTGVSPHVNLMLYKAGRDDARQGTITDGITAIARAYQDDAKIINVSWGGFTDSPMLKKVTKKIADTGVHIVAAAGNYNTNDEFYPAAYDHVIGVAALDRNGKRATFSNYGPWVDVSAPGVDMYTTDLNNSYGSYSGTSEAAPGVAAAIAVAKSYGLDREDIQKNLANTTEQGVGKGVIDLRFICDLAKEEKRKQEIEQLEKELATHDAPSEKSNINYLMLGGGLLILLGLIGSFVAYMLHRKEN